MTWRSSSQASSALCSGGFRLLRSAVALRWILLWIAICFAALAVAFASGCGSRTVLVAEGSPIRIGPDACGRVYSMVDGEWTLSQNKVKVPEGWYLVPPSYVEDER